MSCSLCSENGGHFKPKYGGHFDRFFQFVYKRGGDFIYHSNPFCEHLLTNIDYKIPAIIRNRKDDNLIGIYRKWFENTFPENSIVNDDLIIEKFNSQFKLQFNFDESLNEKNFIEKGNNIKTTFIEQFINFKDITPKMNTILRLYHQIKDSDRSDEEILKVKFDGIELIFELLKWLYNKPNASKDILILEDYGVRHCYTCKKQL